MFFDVQEQELQRLYASLKREASGKKRPGVRAMTTRSPPKPHVVQNVIQTKLLSLITWICILSRLVEIRHHSQIHNNDLD